MIFYEFLNPGYMMSKEKLVSLNLPFCSIFPLNLRTVKSSISFAKVSLLGWFSLQILPKKYTNFFYVFISNLYGYIFQQIRLSNNCDVITNYLYNYLINYIISVILKQARYAYIFLII